MIFEFASIALFTFCIILLVNGFTVLNTGGLSKHSLHAYFLGVSSYYLMVAPTFTFITSDYQLYTKGWGGSVDIENIFDFGMLMIVLHFVCYTVGYFLMFSNRPAHVKDFSSPSHRLNVKNTMEGCVFYLFVFFYMVIFLNTLAGDVNLINVFLGLYGKATLGLRGYTYYLQNFADSLIVLLIAGYYFRIRSLYFWIMVFLAVPLFLVLGFRYRIILFVLGICIIFLRDHKISLLNLFKVLGFVVLFVYSMLVLTQNRTAIYMQEWDKLSLDASELPYEALVEQAKGSRIDFAVYKAIDEGTINHDFGVTNFIYPFIKLTPSFVFSGGKKPYPPPLVRDVHIALDSGENIGEAVTSIGTSYYSFGVLGVILGSLIVGLIIGRLQSSFGRTTFSGLFNLAFALALFMWLTRGYMPGFLDHLVFMLIPVVILKFLHTRILKRAGNV
jgi:hypothetical protein